MKSRPFFERDLRWGDNNVIDDLTGFKIKASEGRHRWDGIFTHADNWEPRHESDFLRSRRDDMSVRVSRIEDEKILATAVLKSDLY